MKSSIVVAVLAFALLHTPALRAAAPEQKPAAPAQDSSKKSDEARSADKSDKDPVAGFDEWARSIEPGEHHKQLERLAGKWTLALKFIEPDGKSTDATGTSEFKPLLGGRFMLEETHTTLEGKPFDWIGWHGYDNIEKKHIADFIDNYGTNIDRMEGACDKDGKEIAYVGKEKMVDGREMKMRWVMKFESPDKVVTEMYADIGDGEKKSLEIIATRAK